ncbi:uncharacterized protein LOC111485806 isoform X1 [Cucurbita maxima]|uniref:Uncharacterized protein LOC111485806 isoform X1 n=1 Tax=Cucurbita maxima TaxID=3661 RepID=A0A6J1JM15_CUCMA|nr:uncharacterized protein LOC111485806 isoform X1 [Cucurbita maxima]
MGCGNSKLTPEGESILPMIRPLLFRTKFAEFRKRKNGTHLRDTALSKKVLLTEGEIEEENSILAVHNRNCIYGSHDGKTICLHTKQENHKDEHDSPNANHPLEQHKPNDNGTRVKLKEDKTMNNQHKAVEEGDDESKGEGEEGRPDNEDNRCLICPGSPSFRVYFVEQTPNEKQNACCTVEMNDDGDMEDASLKKSPSRDSVESTSSTKSNECQEKKTIKKGKKGTTLNRAGSRKRPVGVGLKSLLNVNNCCYHLSCTGNDRGNHLPIKAES